MYLKMNLSFLIKRYDINSFMLTFIYLFIYLTFKHFDNVYDFLFADVKNKE